jgi:hypothetical protein
MGYGPSNTLQTPFHVVALNVTHALASATPGQLCPLAAWSAYWTLRTHGIPTERCAHTPGRRPRQLAGLGCVPLTLEPHFHTSLLFGVRVFVRRVPTGT